MQDTVIDEIIITHLTFNGEIIIMQVTVIKLTRAKL